MSEGRRGSKHPLRVNIVTIPVHKWWRRHCNQWQQTVNTLLHFVGTVWYRWCAVNRPCISKSDKPRRPQGGSSIHCRGGYQSIYLLWCLKRATSSVFFCIKIFILKGPFQCFRRFIAPKKTTPKQYFWSIHVFLSIPLHPSSLSTSPDSRNHHSCKMWTVSWVKTDLLRLRTLTTGLSTAT